METYKINSSYRPKDAVGRSRKNFFMSFQVSWNPLAEGDLEHMELVFTCGDCHVGLLGVGSVGYHLV